MYCELTRDLFFLKNGFPIVSEPLFGSEYAVKPMTCGQTNPLDKENKWHGSGFDVSLLHLRLHDAVLVKRDDDFLHLAQDEMQLRIDVEGF